MPDILPAAEQKREGESLSLGSPSRRKLACVCLT
jgi:hypothetical protein